MRTKWLAIFLLVTFGSLCTASAQVADLAGVLPGDRWVYEVKDEITGDLKLDNYGRRARGFRERNQHTRISAGRDTPATDRVRPKLEPHRRQHLEVHAF